MIGQELRREQQDQNKGGGQHGAKDLATEQMSKYVEDNDSEISHCWRRDSQIWKSWM